jgi:lipid-A-disaccharide synthase-like uncharacterized protein
MHDAIASPLAAWADFYVIVGSSGAALTGLQFVVIALIAESSMARGQSEIAAFGTPTVVHFCSVLLTAALLSMPWSDLTSVAVVLAALGVFGVVYAGLVTHRARRQTSYKPVFEDWLWHSLLPFVAYGALAVAALMLRGGAGQALFVIGAVALLLLFIGIHNSWDTVTYIAIERFGPPRDAPESGSAVLTEAL